MLNFLSFHNTVITMATSDEQLLFDGPLFLPQNVNFAISAPIGSGKTHFMLTVIKHKDQLFADKIDNVYYYYNVYCDAFKTIANLDNVYLNEGLPTLEQIQSLKKNSIVVFDDLSHVLFQNSMILEIALVMARHRKITCFVLLHNLFMKGISSRTFFLNVGVYVLFRTKRGIDQIKHLGRQLFGKGDILLDSYKDATRDKYGFLLVDLESSEDFCLRSNIWPGQDMIIYRPK